MNADRWISLAGLAFVVLGGFYAMLSLTATVTQKFTEVTAEVKSVSTKVDSTASVAQGKVDALADTFKSNQAEQQAFRTSVQSAFGKIFDKQDEQSKALQQERIDRLTDVAKKK